MSKLHKQTQLKVIHDLFDFSLREGNKSTPIGAYLAKELLRRYKLKSAYKSFTGGHEWKSYGNHCFCKYCGKDKNKLKNKKCAPSDTERGEKKDV